jgi:type I restriction enzyme M protein
MLVPIDADLLGLSDIARLAGVRRNVVANWRDRHKDKGFPEPAEETGNGPLYRRDDIVAWLAANRPEAAKKVQPLGFEAQLWKAADALRNNMDASEYKHVVLGLIFLKYISDSFEERRDEILTLADAPDSEYYGDKDAADDRDEYARRHVFWVPSEARWSGLRDAAKQPNIGKLVDDAMVAIERDNPRLKGVLPKDYARPTLDWQRLGQLIDLISGIGVGGKEARDHDVLGRVYEYFLGRFASAEGKGAGQFYTPRSVVRLLVEMMEPYHGRIYDPCCGSGGMFVQSVKFLEAHGGKRSDLSIYGQESNPTTWRLAAMNLAIRGIEADLGPEHGDTFRRDLHPDLKADFVIANPPFNDSHWNGELLRDDVRWKYGVPPVSNANFAWVQHFIHHLSPKGVAGFVLANGSLSSQQSGEGEIRKALVEADLVDCIVALPPQLFYSTPIPVCLWFLARDRANGNFRDRRGEILFIDARNAGHMVDRTHRDFDVADALDIARTYHAWRGKTQNTVYKDVPGYCASVTREGIFTADYVLSPGRYVGSEIEEGDGEEVSQKIARLASQVRAQLKANAALSAKVNLIIDGLAHDS